MARKVWFQSFYDPGIPDRAQEDGIISNAYPLFGALDSHSEPNSPEHPQRIIMGQTTGQLIRDTALRSLSTDYCWFPTFSFTRLLEVVNTSILGTKNAAGLCQPQDCFYSGLSFLIGKIKQKTGVVEIAQGGDCTAVVLLKSGNIKVVWGKKFHPVEVDLRREITRIMKSPEVNGDRGKMWNEFYPFLCWSRKKRANREYPVLDGRQEMMNLVKITSTPLNEIQTIICSTDGMVPWDEKPDWKDWGQKLLSAVKSRKAFETHIKWVRSYEVRRDKESHETNAEASCQAVYFDD